MRIPRASLLSGVASLAAVIIVLPGTAAAASAFPTTLNPTIIQAMQAVRGETTVPLNAPTVIPARTAGYLTATTQASADAYQVTLWDTRRPLHVNNPEIKAARLFPQPVATFGAQQVTGPLPHRVAGDRPLLATHNPVWAGDHPASASAHVYLGDGIPAVAYQAGTTTQLEWVEGDWTLQVVGPSLTAAKKAAVPIVHLLNTYYLPPYPGVYAVRLQAGGRTAVTSLDWIRGAVVSYVTNPRPSATNPVTTGRMAMSWSPYPSTPPPAPGPSRANTPPFAGTSVRFLTGAHVPPAVAPGYHGFSSKDFRPVEGFTGILHGHPFVLEFYARALHGLYVGIRYNARTVYFGTGPAPAFDVLNFTGNWVVLGTPSAGAYIVYNLVTGRLLVATARIAALKGYRGLGTPRRVLGLPGLDVSPNIP